MRFLFLVVFLGIALSLQTAPAIADDTTIPYYGSSITGIDVLAAINILDGGNHDGKSAAIDAFLQGAVWGLHESRVIDKPIGSTNSQIQAMMRKYLEEHPEDLHLPASLLIRKAFVSVWPGPLIGAYADYMEQQIQGFVGQEGE